MYFNFVWWLQFVICQRIATSSGSSQHYYCIVGAGPSGVQLGHFLKRAGRDYVIYEKAKTAGSFFRRFPIHRQLISLNKRIVREGRSAEFAMRHDWNSLLDMRPTLQRTRPVTNRSEALFPHADVLAEYIEEFAEEQSDAIEYGVSVQRIRKVATFSSEEGAFELALKTGGISSKSGSPQRLARCSVVIVATGLQTPREADSTVDGSMHVQGYEALPELGKSFEGKAVIVLGLGNAALETAQALQPYTTELHVFGRRRELPEGGKGVRFAHQTHYVGDIRAGRTTILDTYLLKSLDTFDPDALDHRLLVLRRSDSRLQVFQVSEENCVDDDCRADHTNAAQNVNYLLKIASWLKGSKTREQVLQLFAQFGLEDQGDDTAHGHIDSWEIFTKTVGPDAPMTAADRAARKKLGIVDSVFGAEFEQLLVYVSTFREHPGLLTELGRLHTATMDFGARHPVDHVVRCFGWKMDTTIFDSSTPLPTTHKGKYPDITDGFQSKTTSGLYFAGAITHGLDFRRSAGGFVHGFRYTAHALFRLLEEEHFSVEWPQTNIKLCTANSKAADGLGAAVESLAKLLHGRINEAAAPYQMFQALGDMIVFEEAAPAQSGHDLTHRDQEGQCWLARYLQDVPLAVFHKRYAKSHRIDWVFRYADSFHGPAVLGEARVVSRNPFDAHKSNFLHPLISWYRAGSKKARAAHWIQDDVYTQWQMPDVYSALVRFVSNAIASVLDAGDIMRTNATLGASEDLYEDGFFIQSKRGRRRNRGQTKKSTEL